MDKKPQDQANQGGNPEGELNPQKKPGQGDKRTPDKTIGQIKYADDKTPKAEQEKT